MNNAGGSHAPPMTVEKIAAYKALVSALPKRSPVRDAMSELLRLADAWWEIPDARMSEPGSGPSRLSRETQDALWDVIPWEHELDAIDRVFETIDATEQRDLRNAAYHLLWLARELVIDREPASSDKL